MASTGTVVTVRGSSASHHPPERATVRLTVSAEGPDQAEVYRRTAQAANELADVVRPLVDADGDTGPATRFTTDRLHTWSDRPWDPEKNRQAELVFHAQARMQVTFRDLDVFTRFLDDVGIRPGVAVEQVSWALTEEHERALAREARRRAVADAAERALDYAEAAGFTTVAFTAVADVGLLDDAVPFGSRREKTMAVALGASMMDSGSMQLAPEDITVAAEVEARFLAT